MRRGCGQKKKHGKARVAHQERGTSVYVESLDRMTNLLLKDSSEIVYEPASAARHMRGTGWKEEKEIMKKVLSVF